ncbi:MAG: hypothetical protein K2K40_00595 [Paramuribaculum sp.]|nr:hypothetical protein [Paramuribaculum sp.]
MNNFIITFRKYLADNRKQLILWLALALGGIIFLGAVHAFFRVDNDTSQGIYMVFAPLLMCCFASVTFTNMKRPAGRIAELTLPTTTFNRFAVRWVMAIPATLLLFIAGAWLTELLRMTLWPVFNDTTCPGSLDIFLFTEKTSAITVYFLFLLLTLSFFFFGAIAWPRLSFLKSAIVQWAISTIIGVISVTSIFLFFKDHHIGPLSGNDIDFELYSTLSITFLSVLIVGLWIMAWLRVRESEVTDHLL